MTSASSGTPLAGYYRLHARIYDATRWTFLFGRNQLLRRIARGRRPCRILEIGCGTGKNLELLARTFPQARIVGLDLSADMLDRARPKLLKYGARVSLLHLAYEAPVSTEGKFDLIVLSYCLTMINPGYEKVLRICLDDLASGGVLAVVDFHRSRHPWFRRWMGVNHVRMEGQVLDSLLENYAALTCEVRKAYFGLWQYVSFVGESMPQRTDVRPARLPLETRLL